MKKAKNKNGLSAVTAKKAHSPKNIKKRRRVLPLIICYALAAVIWLGTGAVRLAADGIRQAKGQIEPTWLTWDAFDAIEGQRMINGWEDHHNFVTTDADPQMHLNFENGQRLGYFVFRGMPLNKGGGEMVLYYTTRPGQAFSETQKLWASKAQNGDWYFDLGGKKVYSLRFDVGAEAGVIWHYGGILLNAPRRAASYFVPSVQQWAALLLFPLLVWAILSELFAFIQPIVVRQRFKKRWQAK